MPSPAFKVRCTGTHGYSNQVLSDPCIIADDLVWHCPVKLLTPFIYGRSADCTHELKPVQSGFQLALVYNLVHVSSGPRPAVKDCSKVIAALSAAAQAWGANPASSMRAIWMLEHK